MSKKKLIGVFSSFLFVCFAYSDPCEKIVGKDSQFYHSKSQSFENFVRWTNEKPMIAHEILKCVGDRRASLLDIGAGDGTITKLLEHNFDHITAVEPGAYIFGGLVQTCSSPKFTLINSSFEHTKLETKFDIIVASHSFRFLDKPEFELQRIRDLLKDNGLFLLIELSPDCDYWKFYRTYAHDVLSGCAPGTELLDLKLLLGNVFKVTEVHFTPILSIPGVHEAVNLFDFFYDIEFSKISPAALAKISLDLVFKYGDGPVNINFQQIMYVCSK